MLGFWNTLRTKPTDRLVRTIETFLYNYGTSLHCNRFDVGNCIELAFTEYIKDTGVSAEHTTHAKRTDIKIADAGSLSIKYSSGGTVTLHNVRSGVNTDFTVHPTIVLRPDGMYFLLTEELAAKGIDVADYLVDEKSSLSIKERIFRDIQQRAPHFFLPLTIRAFKKTGLAKNCFELHYYANEILTNADLSEDQKKTACLELCQRYLQTAPTS